MLCNSEMVIEIITLVKGLFEDVCAICGDVNGPSARQYMVGLDLDLIKICVPSRLGSDTNKCIKPRSNSDGHDWTWTQFLA